MIGHGNTGSGREGDMAIRFGGVLASLSLMLGATSMGHAASEIRVAATIAPIHSLAAMVTEGVIEPDLIIRPGASPHGYAMKPSEARALDQADVVFWVGDGLESWMVKAIETLAADAEVVELAAADGVHRLGRREGGVWAHQGHDDHADHDDSQGIDPHLWLDPDNAVIWLNVMADALAGADPANAKAYKTNARQAEERLAAMASDIEVLLDPLKETPYVVFHDAYQYFERRFNLHPIGSISLDDADRPGPARIVDIRKRIVQSKAVCVFTEPQFEPKLIDTVIEGSSIKKGVLDPIGAGLQPGPDLHPALMRNLADALLTCLG